MAGGTESLEQFKRRLPLADIVGRYVKLNRRGREHTGLCPFHQEKTPSFHVVEDKGFYHCFGCGAHGDAIAFVMNVEGLDFAAALERLADITGIEPPARSEKTVRIDPGLYDANAAAARYFQKLLAGAEGSGARDYLHSRGLKSDAIQEFGMGYGGPDRHALKTWLASNSIPEALAIEAGLLITPEDGGSSFDRFRERLIIPIADRRGRIVGFGGRAMAGQKAKYLNSPDTPVFHKGEILFNLHRAAPVARKEGRILVAEGYMDVIALHQAGFPEAVAPLGTAVTEDQLRLLWQVADKPIVCLDGDAAGRRAALRMAERALTVMNSGQGLDFVLLPDGEDPDSFIQNRGAEAFAGLVRTPLPLSRLIWSEELKALPIKSPEDAAALRARLFGYVETTRDHNLKLALKDQFKALLNARRAQLYEQSRGARRSNPQGAKREPKWAARWDGSGGLLGATNQLSDAGRERRLLAYFLIDPSLLERHAETLAEMRFADRANDSVRHEILNGFAALPHLDGEGLRYHLIAHGHKSVVEQLAALAPEPGEVAEMAGNGEIERLFETLRAGMALQHSREELENLIKGGSDESLDIRRRALDELINSHGKRHTS